jgi:hypothetical protein
MARSNNRGEFRVSWPNQIAGGPVAQSGKLDASNVMWRCVAGERPQQGLQAELGLGL